MRAYLVLGVFGVILAHTLAVTVEQATVDVHNAARRAEAKAEGASNLYEYVWDHDLSVNARDWAAGCVFAHQHIHGQGENLYWSSPKNHPDDYYIQRAVNRWMGEKQYNDGSFDCCYHNASPSCCHYTQVVASKSKMVACAVHECAELKNSNDHVVGHNAAYVVCEYSPMGNVAISGNHETYTSGNHETYASGNPCSACDSGDTCNDGLCVA